MPLYISRQDFSVLHTNIICALRIILPDPQFTPKDTLRAWQEKNHPWLELSDVHRETTEGIRVTVIPFYMGARVSFFVFVFVCL